MGLSDLSKNDMGEMIRAFPNLLRLSSLDSSVEEHVGDISHGLPEGICFVGMGGSSISGEYVRAILADESPIPIVSVRSYSLPAFVDEKWVVVAVSYSGNTEETVSAYREARVRSCRVFCVTTGGELGRISNAGYTQRIPEGLQPRAALPILLSVTMGLTERVLGLEPTDFGKVSENVQRNQEVWGSHIDRPETLASEVHGSVPLFLAQGHLVPVAYRAKCQFNENAKYSAFSLEMPEANHNEIEASVSYQRFAIRPIFLESSFQSERMSRRYEATRAVMSTERSMKLTIPSENRLDEMLSLTHYLDMVSLELARLHGVDPVGVDRISELKSRLAG